METNLSCSIPHLGCVSVPSINMMAQGEKQVQLFGSHNKDLAKLSLSVSFLLFLTLLVSNMSSHCNNMEGEMVKDAQTHTRPRQASSIRVAMTTPPSWGPHGGISNGIPLLVISSNACSRSSVFQRVAVIVLAGWRPAGLLDEKCISQFCLTRIRDTMCDEDSAAF